MYVDKLRVYVGKLHLNLVGNKLLHLVNKD